MLPKEGWAGPLGSSSTGLGRRLLPRMAANKATTPGSPAPSSPGWESEGAVLARAFWQDSCMPKAIFLPAPGQRLRGECGLR